VCWSACRPCLDWVQPHGSIWPLGLPTCARGSKGSSALSKACQYALTLWKKLTRFLEYPELELSTNLAENSMRPVALGRKNWLHIGSPQTGSKVAAILSVVESCRRLKARLFGRGSPGVWRSPDPVPPRSHFRCVGRPAFINPSDGGCGVKVVLRQQPQARIMTFCPDALYSLQVYDWGLLDRNSGPLKRLAAGNRTPPQCESHAATARRDKPDWRVTGVNSETEAHA
jgi:hypothetical protein